MIIYSVRKQSNGENSSQGFMKIKRIFIAGIHENKENDLSSNVVKIKRMIFLGIHENKENDLSRDS